jgi:hypothetical protein
MSDGNGKPVDVVPGNGGPLYTLSITWDVATGDFNVTGLNVPPWASLGMLKYMEMIIRRRDAEQAMVEAARRVGKFPILGGRA